MKTNKELLEKCAKQLLKKSSEMFENNESIVHFVDNEKQNNFLNDLEIFPHAFVLACLMDRQIKAERAWSIPYHIYKEIGDFDIYALKKVGLGFYKNIFSKKNLHRFNDTSAKVFYKGVCHIIDKYDGNANKIWSNNPSSAQVVYRFLEFEGCGIKIATMTANILARQFKIKMSDYYSIDISPDVHIKRVMYRLGFVDKNSKVEMIIYKARELNPKFPGLIDFACWQIGREYCRPNFNECRCDECFMKNVCPCNRE